MLAEKGEKGWHNSDPIALTEWFTDQVQKQGDQLRRAVRYMKAWADFQSVKRGKMSTSLILTALVAQNFRSHERDDVSLARYRQSYLRRRCVSIVSVYNPVDGTEELTQRLSDEEKKRLPRRNCRSGERCR